MAHVIRVISFADNLPSFIVQRGGRLSAGSAGLKSSKEHLMTILNSLLTLLNS
jgi:hypothetical protein